MRWFKREPEKLPEKVELAVGVKPEDGKIIDIGPYRHRVDWVEGGPSSVTYCNNCGGSFTKEGRLVSRFAPDIPRERRPRVAECASCGAFQGFLKHEPLNKHTASGA